jgi:hypothetical protein
VSPECHRRDDAGDGFEHGAATDLSHAAVVYHLAEGFHQARRQLAN